MLPLMADSLAVGKEIIKLVRKETADLFLKALQKSVDKLSEPGAFPDCISLIVLNTSEPSDGLSHSSTICSGDLGKLDFMEKL